MTQILLVDDHAGMMDLLRRTLNGLGFHNVDVETRSARVGKRLAEKAYDLVISDWDMVPVNGSELRRHLRSLPDYADTPFIMLTAHKSRKLDEEMAADPHARILSKPFMPNDVAEIMKAVIG